MTKSPPSNEYPTDTYTEHRLSDKCIFEFGPKNCTIPKSISPSKSIAFKVISHAGYHPPANLRTAASDKCFTLTPKHPCDISSKSPEHHVFDAPMFYNVINLDEFQRTRVTISSKWETHGDQGGLIFVLPKDGKVTCGKWIKTGIEFCDDRTFISTVVRDRLADCAFAPHKVNEVTLEMERKDKSLWINIICGKKATPVREITWALSEKDQPIWVGVYAAKPKEGGKKCLEVKFKNWHLETIHGVHKGHTESMFTETECKNNDRKHIDKKCDH